MRLILTLLIAVKFISCTDPLTNTDVTCPYSPKCDCDNQILTCTNFDELTDLNFKLETTSSNNQIIFNKIVIRPRVESTLAEDSLDLDGLTIVSSGMVEISNIKTFHLNANPLKKLKVKENRFTVILKLSNSTFKFMYDDSNPLNEKCSSSQLSDVSNVKSIFTSANFVYLENVNFVEPICPLLFANVRISNFQIINPVKHDSQRSFHFLSTADVHSHPKRKVDNYKKIYEISALNSFVKYLFIENAQFDDLDSSSVLNRDVFSAVQVIRLKNVHIAHNIEANLFNEFNYLKKLDFDKLNWGDLVSRSQLDWMYLLNANAKTVDFTKSKQPSSDKFTMMMNFGDYQIDDERDFCKFAYFPLEKYVVPYIQANARTGCNCVVTWLLRYSDAYAFDNDFTATSGNYRKCLTNPESSIEHCTRLKSSLNCDSHPPRSLALLNHKESTGFMNISWTTLIVALVVLTLLTIMTVYFMRKRFARHEDRSMQVITSRNMDANEENATEMNQFL